MCRGFGAIVDKELNVWFCEPDKNGDCSHSIILERLGWRDNTDQFKRNFVRVQYPGWTSDSFVFDENATLPAWVEEHKQEITDNCNRILGRVSPALAEYKKVSGPAWEEYEKVNDAAWIKFTQTISSIPGFVGD